MTTAPPSRDHDHAGFDLPADPLGRPVDAALIAGFVGAGYDGCAQCQEALLPQLAGDAPSAARLVEIACMMVAEVLGGLPPSTLDDDGPGLSSPEFRRLARAGVGGNNDRMFTECERMSSEQRAAAISTAADMIVGYLLMVG